ncbi:hypothetical protein P3T37_000332 [Kitasatospora sp. MAA4]|uniref:RNaseH domain-containing protein n=1 Tax=Kitasatospora sp. MAA4 TaxID=3035093 RepID=UPI002476F1E1|nr:RNaseH domain-containing protein [Kitasatospora sp. MAA4]MDH6130965.1 hypothetical protein [Kitasatospora sp. MAA4]
MTATDTTDPTADSKRKAPPSYAHILIPTFTARPDAELKASMHIAPFPPALLERLLRAWANNPDSDSPYLPTYALRELVQQVEPAVVAVAGRLDEGGPWLYALQQPKDELPLQLAIEAWAVAHVAPHQEDVDWPTIIKSAMPLQWTNKEVNLLGTGQMPNGTAAPHPPAFDLLASYITASWVDNKLAMPGQPHNGHLVLGPMEDRGARSLYTWPPQELTDDDGAHGLWTHRTCLRIISMPHDGQLLLRATPHIARFGGTQPAYIPRRGGKPAQATVLMYLPSGALRSVERPMLLKVPVTVTGKKLDMRWRSLPSIARILPSLPSSQHYPDPEQVRTDPRSAAGLHRPEPRRGDPAALLLHSTGYTYFAPTDDEPLSPKTPTHGHPAETGLQPIDHLQLFEHLKAPLSAFHFTPVEPRAKAPQRRPPRVEPARDNAHHILELWHSHPDTYQAIHLALTGLLGYRHRAQDPEQAALHHYDGSTTLSIQLINPDTVTSGLPKPDKDATTEGRRAHRAEQRRTRIDELGRAFPDTGQLVGCLVEIDKPVAFALAYQDDPKPLLKQTLPALGRHVQCLHPITRTANPQAKNSAAQPFPGSTIRNDDVHRAASAVRDILRSIGHLPRLSRPRGLDGPFEIVTVHIAKARNGVVPYILRSHTDGTTTGQLIPTPKHPREAPIDIQDLPRALVNGRGRLPWRERQQLVDFITQALATDSHTPRLFLARAQSLRRTDLWPWLQNPHISPNQLRLPGQDCTGVLPGPARTPADLPGLRIVRINEAPDEIPLAFGVNLPTAEQHDETPKPTPSPADPDDIAPLVSDADDALPYEEWGRYSGVVPWNDHTYLAINPRPDTNRLAKTASKYDGLNYLSRHGANPHALEIHISFHQADDNPADLAAYVNHLRRCHLHTDTPTALPWLQHHAKLLEEYID